MVLVHPTRQGFSRILPRLVEPNLHQNLVLQLPYSSPGGASIMPLQCSGYHPTLLKAISLIIWIISVGKIGLGLLLRLWVLLSPCSQTPQICSLPAWGGWAGILLPWHSHRCETRTGSRISPATFTPIIKWKVLLILQHQGKKCRVSKEQQQIQFSPHKYQDICFPSLEV